MDEEKIPLIAIGFAAIFGLQSALILSAKHLLVNKSHQQSACKRILISKEALFANIPIPYLAVIFYSLVLLQLIQCIYSGEIHVFWINIEILFALLTTFYYAYVMIVKLRTICMGCISIYISNIIMAAALIAYHFHLY